ncbi:MAG: peptide chain release factor N(5)-glutamine methyltransferase, partial [Pseudomonadota bacterium]
MTGQDLLRLGIAQLRAAGVPDPATDARRLIARALGLPPERLTLALTEDASPQEID